MGAWESAGQKPLLGRGAASKGDCEFIDSSVIGAPAALRDGFASAFGWLGDVLPEPFQGGAQDARDVHLRNADPLRDLMLSQVFDEP